MTANIAPIIYAAAFIVFMALCLCHAHKMRKPTLRELCRREYGDKFAEDYDELREDAKNLMEGAMELWERMVMESE